jgi:hypothetical protein
MNEPNTSRPLPNTPAIHNEWYDWLTSPSTERWLLPLTGAWILGLDWLLFSDDAVTLGLAMPLTCMVGLVAGGVGTYYFQRRYGGDSKPHAGLKAILAGIVVGLPFPLAGTLVGGWILMTSGLKGLLGKGFFGHKLSR